MEQAQFEELARTLGFRTSGPAAWGERGGYWFSLETSGPDIMKLRTAVDGREESIRLQLDSWLAAAKSAGRITEYTDKDGSVTASLPVGRRVAPLIEKPRGGLQCLHHGGHDPAGRVRTDADLVGVRFHRLGQHLNPAKFFHGTLVWHRCGRPGS